MAQDFTLKRAALYIRVSTEEQAMHGYSLPAQKDALLHYAKEHSLFVVGCYIDDGYSARKGLTRRKDFMRMMEDVEADRIDLILFIKLDRWFRSVKDYYKVQEILDAHHVNWKAILEDYDTTTSGGQLHINIMLSVAQNESDRTSERIKFVFDDKRRRGEAVTGRTPVGIKIENKHYVPNPETADMVRDLFSFFESTGIKYRTRFYIREKYNFFIGDGTMSKMLTNPIYKGELYGTPNACEAIIPPEQFDRVQEICKNRACKKTPSNRLYIFSGILYCSECGKRMTGKYTYEARYGHEYYSYRCNSYWLNKQCCNNSTINEKKVETYLLEHIEDCIRGFLEQYDCVEKEAEQSHQQKAQLVKKLGRLKELYVNELIDMTSYKRDYEEYSRQIQLLEAKATRTPSKEVFTDFLKSGFQLEYNALSREERQIAWRKIIKRVDFTPGESFHIFLT